MIPPSKTFASRLTARSVLGAAVSLLTLTAGCNGAPPPGADRRGESPPPPATEQVGTKAPVPPASAAPSAAEAEEASSAAPTAEAAPEPYNGPWFVVTDSSAGVYGDTSFTRKQKIGYLRSGSRVPVAAEPIARDDCPKGWYRLRDGGFVCGSAGTTNVNSPEARFAIRAPNLANVLPYTYARNAKNGTPLYRSVPTVEQMRQYEPYLVKKTEDASSDKASAPAAPLGTAPALAVKPEDNALPFTKEAMARARDTERPVEKAVAAAARASDPPSAPALPDGGVDDSDKPWWQRHDVEKRLHEVKLDELQADADAILAKRMVKGFYVAVDREFNWNGRPWYKTTKGLVAPADRFWITQGSEFHGTELDGERLSLPVGWTYGWQKGRPKYTLDAATGRMQAAGTLEYRALVPLTGKDVRVGGKRYVESKDGYWVLASQLRITEPGPPPADLAPNERWIDVNLSTQTLVVFEGTRPIYATLISSGKENKVDKEKDHRTPTGDFRVREKHVTTTMDGDGTAAGDLPYSIEDVPYVMYFYKAYALHGAFWHSNYGTQMSHGCVNLAPLDAKWVFMNTEPRMPEGWHGVWATAEHPGSRVIVHDDSEPKPSREAAEVARP
ncbi:MAG TPA: L,D-transpeptidase [Polyangiaceae bacterium]|nr:L,D-transpeptidase [Polyangiaceae bacterium]